MTRLFPKEDRSASPLHAASLGNARVGMAKLLAKSSTHVDVRDDLGRTPLMYALRYNNTWAVEELRGAGASLAARDNDGRTPLHWSMVFDHWKDDTLRMLVAAGADPNAVDKRGRQPHHYGLMRSGFFWSIAPNFADYNWTWDEPDSDGETPIMVLATRHDSCPHVLKTIEKQGLDIHALDKEGYGFLERAVAAANISLITHLLSIGIEQKMRDETVANFKKPYVGPELVDELRALHGRWSINQDKTMQAIIDSKGPPTAKRERIL